MTTDMVKGPNWRWSRVRGFTEAVSSMDFKEEEKPVLARHARNHAMASGGEGGAPGGWGLD